MSKHFTIDLRRLRVLQELRERGTIWATAEALHLTPSAISQQISVLSREAPCDQPATSMLPCGMDLSVRPPWH